MARTNVKEKTERPTTHQGSPAYRVGALAELRRTTMATLIWEDQFYEEGEAIATRLRNLVDQVSLEEAAEVAIEAREVMNLRHTPLWIVRHMARRGGSIVGDTLARVIKRADEIPEFLAMYWQQDSAPAKKSRYSPGYWDKPPAPKIVRGPIAAQVKRGLAKAFQKFDEYQLAKYHNRDGAVKLRDVLRLTHPTPRDPAQALLWKQLKEKTLPPPETWEVLLSAGGDKAAVFTHLLLEQGLGGLAMLMNLRNMLQAGVDRDLIRCVIAEHPFKYVLPFRFVSAAKAAPELEQELDAAMLRIAAQGPKLAGRTLIIIDVSGSMYGSSLSSKSDMDRMTAAATLGAILREMCDDPAVYATAGNDSSRKHATGLVPPRRGMALIDAIKKMPQTLGGGGIFLTPVCRWLAEKETDVARMIVVTDEQDCAGEGSNSPLNAIPLAPAGHNYLINVASYKHGIGYGKWTHIDGWSEGVVRYVQTSEMQQQ